MINEENDGVEETEVEETETESETENEEETQEEEKGVDYWKAEALKNKAILDRNKNKPATSQKSSDFGYDVKAYLKASGIKAEEFDFVKGEMKSARCWRINTFNQSSKNTAKSHAHPKRHQRVIAQAE